MLNVAGLDFEAKTAFGFNVEKRCTAVNNFGALVSWREDKCERLHGSNLVFRPEFSERPTFKEPTWEKSNFKALHFCFFPRSPSDRTCKPRSILDGRPNPFELQKREARMRRRLFRWYYDRLRPGYKATRYVGQDVGIVNVSNFGNPSDFRLYDPDCDQLVSIIERVTDDRRHLLNQSR